MKIIPTVAFRPLFRCMTVMSMISATTMSARRRTATRTGVRWLCLRNAAGRGVQFIGRQPLSVAVRRCSPEALEEAGHASEAECSSDRLTVNIDLVQAGVGGTDSWSIKARPEMPYRLCEKVYNYGFLIVPGQASDCIRNGRMYR